MSSQKFLKWFRSNSYRFKIKPSIQYLPNGEWIITFAEAPDVSIVHIADELIVGIRLEGFDEIINGNYPAIIFHDEQRQDLLDWCNKSLTKDHYICFYLLGLGEDLKILTFEEIKKDKMSFACAMIKPILKSNKKKYAKGRNMERGLRFKMHELTSLKPQKERGKYIGKNPFTKKKMILSWMIIMGLFK